MTWTTKTIPPQSGRCVVITGANSGIGFQAALELARKGAELVLPARTKAKSADAIARIKAEVPGATITPGVLDLASLASVRAFAAFFVERFPGPSLDLLINNAGVMALPVRELTVDGFERQFATNYLGPFALTALLFRSIKAQPGSRIVTLASGAANSGIIAFDNLQSERVYKPMGTYSQSKLADLMFALALQNRLTKVNSPITSTSAHPGYAVTNLQADHLPFGVKLMSALMKPFSHDAVHGALPTLFAAVEPTAQPGGYYGPEGFLELKGDPAPAKIPAQAKDRTVAHRLWAESERLTDIIFPTLSAAV